MLIGICSLSAVPMRKLQSDQSEMTNQILFGETFNIWNKKNKNNVVTKEATLPGIFLNFPIPNNVTKRKLILLYIFNNRRYHFACYSFFFSYQT